MTRPLRFATAVAVVVLAVPGSVSGQASSRTDAALRYIMREGARVLPRAPAGPEAISERRLGVVGGTWPGPAPALEATPTGLVVHTLVRLRPGGEQALLRAGARIGTRAGDIVTARIPLAALPGLANAPQLRFLEAASSLQLSGRMPPTERAANSGETGAPSSGAGVDTAAGRAAVSPVPVMPNDVTRAEIRVNELRRRVGDHWVGLAGQGVIVGIVDSGLDLKHGDFLDPAGKTRVIAAWDQTANGTPPGVIGGNDFDYGTVCTSDDIDGGTCPIDDINGHGTHVLGTAAGDGSATGNGEPAYQFAGVAPEADLIVVKGGDLGIGSDNVIDGVAYIFAMAKKLGRPAVVNLSLETANGPHDGTTLFEQALDNLSGPGRILVAAAGNFGANNDEMPAFPDGPMHAMGDAGGPADTLLVPEYTPAPGALNDGVNLQLWYSGADSLAVTVLSPSGATVTAATGDTASLDSPEGGVAIDNASGGSDPQNGDRQVTIGLGDARADAPPKPGRWLIRVRADHLGPGSTGRYHLWLVGYKLDLTSNQGPQLPGGSNRYVVTMPATADRVIAVAAYAARHHWTGLGGTRQSFTFQEPLGDIALFSGPGPRRDGVLKPDLAAPGKVVISSMSRDAGIWQPQKRHYLIEADSVHAGLIGTSMAAPAVTGTVALLLQLQPDLTPEAARELLVRSARQDRFTAHPYTGQPNAVPNAQWGYGKLDAAAAAQRLRPEGITPSGEQVNLSENPVRGDALNISYGEKPKSIAVYSLTGRRVRVFGDGEIGPLSTVWPLDNERGAAVVNGPYLIVLDFAHNRVVKKVFVVRQ